MIAKAITHTTIAALSPCFESLRTCLALLVQDPVLRKRLAIQGFETVKKGYSVENSVDALLGLYKEVLHG